MIKKKEEKRNHSGGLHNAVCSNSYAHTVKNTCCVHIPFFRKGKIILSKKAITLQQQQEEGRKWKDSINHELDSQEGTKERKQSWKMTERGKSTQSSLCVHTDINTPAVL